MKRCRVVAFATMRAAATVSVGRRPGPRHLTRCPAARGRVRSHGSQPRFVWPRPNRRDCRSAQTCPAVARAVSSKGGGGLVSQLRFGLRMFFR